MNCGRMLRKERFAIGLTQVQLAKRIGCNQANVSSVESSGNYMSLSTLFTYATALGKTVRIEFETTKIGNKEGTSEMCKL